MHDGRLGQLPRARNVEVVSGESAYAYVCLLALRQHKLTYASLLCNLEVVSGEAGASKALSRHN